MRETPITFINYIEKTGEQKGKTGKQKGKTEKVIRTGFCPTGDGKTIQKTADYNKETTDL